MSRKMYLNENRLGWKKELVLEDPPKHRRIADKRHLFLI